MPNPDEAIQEAISEVDRLRSNLRKRSAPQVRGAEREPIRAVTLAWFHSLRPPLQQTCSADDLRPIDQIYQWLLEMSHKSAARARYTNDLKHLSNQLVSLRCSQAVKLSVVPAAGAPPDFSKLVSNSEMRGILDKRWRECGLCVSSGAPLAAVVMMGGLLEGLLLARVNHENDKKRVFTARAAPKGKDNRPLPLKDWTLHDYIGVAHELKWITVAAKDIGLVLRDYRNYVHPQKELSHAVSLTALDAVLLWQISTSIANQLLG